MNGFLEKILATKAEEVVSRAAARPLVEVRAAIDNLSPPRGFLAAIENAWAETRPAIIAEIKKASPSAGIIRADFDPATIAKQYAENGATCLSVLTDRHYFQGDDRNIGEARAACILPVLRKDFTIDSYQVFEARLIGADAILLIVAALGDPALFELAELAHALDMDVLIEVHNADELARALAVPGCLIGINNRNLQTFETDLNTTLQLLDSIPKNRIVVTESGLKCREDIVLMEQHSVHAFLIGESLMRAPDPGMQLKTLFGV